LIKFHQRNQFLPEKLIFYRDGVSEGQFTDVVAKEVPLVRQAIYAMGEKEIYKVGAIRLFFFFE
jgi:eukaryotic translation initiation factor 2C